MWKQLKSLLGQSVIYGLGNAAIGLISLLLVPLFTHCMSAQEYGIYSVVIVSYGLLSVFADFGYTNSVGRYYFPDEVELTPEQISEQRSCVLSTALIASVAVSATVSLTVALLAGPAVKAGWAQGATTANLLAVAAAVFFRGLTVVPHIWLRVAERSGAYVVITVLQVVTFLAFNVIALYHLRMGVQGALLSLAASQAVCAVGSLLIFRIPGAFRFSGNMLRELTRFGIPFLPVLLMMWVVDFSDRYLMEYYTTAYEVGVYSLGAKFGQCMLFVVTAFSAGWVPIRFKLLSLEDNRSVYGRIATFYVALGGTGWVALTIFAQELVRWTSPPEFYQGWRFISPVAYGYFFYGLFVVSVTGAGVAKRVEKVPFAVAAAAIFNIVLNVLFLPVIGAMASALATIASYVTMVAGGVWISQQAYPIEYEYGKMARILLGQFAIALIGCMLPTPWKFALSIPLFAAAVALPLRVGILRPAELASVPGAIPGLSPRLRGWVASGLGLCAGPQKTDDTAGEPS